MNITQKPGVITSDYFYIYTLGNFRVYCGEKLISESSHRAHRLWCLFISWAISGFTAVKN